MKDKKPPVKNQSVMCGKKKETQNRGTGGKTAMKIRLQGSLENDKKKGKQETRLWKERDKGEKQETDCGTKFGNTKRASRACAGRGELTC